VDRDRAAILADVLDGKIASTAEYGLFLTPDAPRWTRGHEAAAGRRWRGQLGAALLGLGWPPRAPP